MKTLSLKKTSTDVGENDLVSDAYALKKIEQIQRKYNIVNYYHGLSGEQIRPGMCIYRDPVNKLSIQIPTKKSKNEKSLGVSLTDAAKGDRITIAESGLLTNIAFKFTTKPGSPLWLGYEGDVTDMMPTFGPTKILGFVVSENTAFILSENVNCGYSVNVHEQFSHSSRWRIPYTNKVHNIIVYKLIDNRNKLSTDHIVDVKDGFIEIRFNEKFKGRVVYSMLY